MAITKKEINNTTTHLANAEYLLSTLFEENENLRDEIERLEEELKQREENGNE